MKEQRPQAMNYLKSEADVERYIDTWCRNTERLHDAINRIMVEKEINLTELMVNSRINRNYGYNIVNGRRENPGRDKVLAICIAAQLSLEEAEELLAIAKVAGLYYRSERDVRIAYALNKKVGDVLEVNIMLSDAGLEPLNV